MDWLLYAQSLLHHRRRRAYL